MKDTVQNLNIAHTAIVVLLCLLAIMFLIAMSLFCLKMIKQQVRLHNSIILVELKSPKIIYWIIFVVMIFFTVYFFAGAINPALPTFLFITEVLELEIWAQHLAIAALTMIFFCVTLIFLMLAVSSAALVDRGVYTKVEFFDWYHIYDYFVDEDQNTVTLSKNKSGPLSLFGMSPPLKFNKNDIEKVKFILNKNKNKFLTDYELR